MKKMIFAVGLMLSGVIGFVGWCVVMAVLNFEFLAYDTIFGHFSVLDWVVAGIFAVMAIVGIVMAVVEVKKDDVVGVDSISTRP